LKEYKLRWDKHKPEQKEDNVLQIKQNALKNLERELKELRKTKRSATRFSRTRYI